jgi:hypothetical protein
VPEGISYIGSQAFESPVVFDAAVVFTSYAPLTLNAPATFNSSVTGTSPTFSGTVSVASLAATGTLSALHLEAPAVSAGQPDVAGLRAWNFPTYVMGGTATFPVQGTVYGAALHLTPGVTYSTMYVRVLANVGTASAGSCFAGVYNSLGTLVATTNDVSGVLGTAAGTTGYLAFPLATAYTPAAGGIFYAGMFFNASGTASYPVLQGLQQQTAANSVTTLAGTVNGPLGTTPAVFWATATTSGTAMPVSFSLSALGTTGAQCPWVGLA